jgi:hypothetical protein
VLGNRSADVDHPANNLPEGLFPTQVARPLRFLA